MGVVMYAANVLGSRGPRKMQVALPGLEENNQIISFKDGSNPDMITRMKERNFKDLGYLINKPPRWNDTVGAYVLNFNGRVTMASVKNFQLVDPDEQNEVVLQVNDTLTRRYLCAICLYLCQSSHLSIFYE